MSVRLFVLGILNEGETHGYRIKEIAGDWKLEKWADIGYGSIYHALAMLEEEELILKVATEQTAGRPPRSIYRITDQGRAVLRELMQEAGRMGHQRKHPINLALSFLTQLPPQERAALLEERLRRLEADQAILRERRDELAMSGGEPPWVIATLDHDLGHCEFEIGWTRRLLQEVPGWTARPDRGAAAATAPAFSRVPAESRGRSRAR
jgi:DNA-binding PadR family transcriptional regulator